MFNELERLRDLPDLFTLLTHYADLAAPDRQVWQDRRMALGECEPKQMHRLHGELIAHGWLELNIDALPPAKPGEVPGCYRVTREGLRALKQVNAGEID